MNAYTYQREVRAMARLGQSANAAPFKLFPDGDLTRVAVDLYHAARARSRRLAFFNVTDGRITTRAQADRARGAR